MTTKTEIEQVQDMLAHFICADANDDGLMTLSTHSLKKSASVGLEVDAGAKLQFQQRRPTTAYTCDLSESREFATDAQLLLSTPQDILGNHAEIALVSGGMVKWACFRKIQRRPKGVWIGKAGADLYEYHSRFIFSDGSSDYRKRVAAIDKHGRPVQTIIEGTKNAGSGAPDGLALVMAASIIEDASRPGTFKATVTDSVGLVFPVNQGAHLELFKLRDGPNIGNRKRPLLHWVASHMRKNKAGGADVKQHLRGVHEFSMDGLLVRLDGAA